MALIAVFSMEAPAAAPGATPPRVLRIVSTDWSSWCPCPEDCVQRDTFFVRVQPGSEFRVPHDYWRTTLEDRPFRVTSVDANGRMAMFAPDWLRVQRSGHEPAPANAFVLGALPETLTTASFDAGMTFYLQAYHDAPPGAVFGLPLHSRPKPPSKARSFKLISGVRLPLPLPRGVKLPPHGDVVVVGTIAPDGSVASARIPNSVSPQLDSLALRAVRSWRLEPGRDCEGNVAWTWSAAVSFAPSAR